MTAIAARQRSKSGRKPAWRLCLYVADKTPRSLLAFANLKRFCQEQLGARYTIEVIDVVAQPLAAIADNIVALPTLVRRVPGPERTVIGDLSDTARLLTLLDVRIQA